MRSDDLLEIVRSPTRLRMIDTLRDRPRCPTELSEILGVTTQAVMKHLDLLLRRKIVKVLPIGAAVKSPVKRVYDLDVRFGVGLDLSDEVSSVHVLVSEGEATMKGVAKTARQDVLNALDEIQEEMAAVKRRLKSAREREERLFRELVEYEAMQTNLLDRHAPEPFDRMVLLASLDPDPEKEIDRIKRHMKVRQELISEILHRYSEPRR